MKTTELCPLVAVGKGRNSVKLYRKRIKSAQLSTGHFLLYSTNDILCDLCGEIIGFSLEFHFCVCSELEQYVITLQKTSATTNRAVTLKDVEEGAVTLRKVGESLAGLKGETTKSITHTGKQNCVQD